MSTSSESSSEEESVPPAPPSICNNNKLRQRESLLKSSSIRTTFVEEDHYEYDQFNNSKARPSVEGIQNGEEESSGHDKPFSLERQESLVYDPHSTYHGDVQHQNPPQFPSQITEYSSSQHSSQPTNYDHEHKIFSQEFEDNYDDLMGDAMDYSQNIGTISEDVHKLSLDSPVIAESVYVAESVIMPTRNEGETSPILNLSLIHISEPTRRI